jgi:biotin carboxyl carrier protein
MAGMNPSGDGPRARRAVRVTLAPEHAPVEAIVVEDRAVGGDGRDRPELSWLDAERARLQPEGAAVLLLPPERGGRIPAGVTRREILVEGWRLVVDVEPAARAELRERASRVGAAAVRRGPTEVHAMIPGRVLSIGVVAGDTVTAGQAVMIIEAMKMQNELRVPRAGVIGRVAVSAGANVELGDLLISIEPESGSLPS